MGNLVNETCTKVKEIAARHKGAINFLESFFLTSAGIAVPYVACQILLMAGCFDQFPEYIVSSVSKSGFTFGISSILFLEMIGSGNKRLSKQISWGVGLILLAVVLFTSGARYRKAMSSGSLTSRLPECMITKMLGCVRAMEAPS